MKTMGEIYLKWLDDMTEIWGHSISNKAEIKSDDIEKITREAKIDMLVSQIVGGF